MTMSNCTTRYAEAVDRASLSRDWPGRIPRSHQRRYCMQQSNPNQISVSRTSTRRESWRWALSACHPASLILAGIPFFMLHHHVVCVCFQHATRDGEPVRCLVAVLVVTEAVCVTIQIVADPEGWESLGASPGHMVVGILWSP